MESFWVGGLFIYQQGSFRRQRKRRHSEEVKREAERKVSWQEQETLEASEEDRQTLSRSSRVRVALPTPRF